MVTVLEKEGLEHTRKRAAVTLNRFHQRFLLFQLQFTQQYAFMYQCRVDALRQRVLDAICAKIAVTHPDSISKLRVTRVLDLVPGHHALCVGVLYKQMPFLPRFLDEYQKELIRIDAGEEDDGEEDDAGIAFCETLGPADGRAIAPNTQKEGEVEAKTDNYDGVASTQRGVSLCTAKDELFLEDSSGRIMLQGIDAELFSTGIVLAVAGTLQENGRLFVHTYALTDLREIYVPRLLRGGPRPLPCYVGFVCGLNLGCAKMQDPEVARGRTMVELLVDYLSGNVGDEAMVTQASRIARLVIGGNSIASTDELRLKRKVKLDPFDHARLGFDKLDSESVTSTMLMKELDAVVTRIAETIEVELMPGDNDMTNAFYPQQPIHPLLLPEAARRSSLKLVTNPYEFAVLPDDSLAEATPTTGESPSVFEAKDATNGGTVFFVSSGSNLDDFSRQTRYQTRLDAMTMLLRSGCACPTAPNTLFSYPFKGTDPFIFSRAPHCFVCCGQPVMQTQWVPLESFSPVSDVIGNEEAEGPPHIDGAGVRLVCVPSFAQSGTLVLVDVNSQQLDTTVVNFASSSHLLSQ